MAVDLSKIRKFNIDLEKGVFQSDGEDDHRRMMETLGAIDRIGVMKQNTTPQPPPAGESLKVPPISLRLPELVDKFFELNKHKRPSTAQGYKNAVNEFSGFLGNAYLHTVSKSDITRYQEHIAKINSTRTIDNKIGVLSSMFNFAIKQGYYFGDNPAAGRMLMSKKDKNKGGYAIFEDIEVMSLYSHRVLAKHKEKDPDFYLCILLGLISGCRISEITSLQVSQIRSDPIPYIQITDSKTTAGIRDVPIPQVVYDELKAFMPSKGKIFRYQDRLGKGSGNAVSQKFKRMMLEVGVTRERLVFHSLRKYLNNKMMNEGVQIEARCQFFGHELDNVNVTTYAQSYGIKELAELTLPIQLGILNKIGFEK